jgi:hypothetical protein
VKDVAGFSKSIKASLDNSALLRQGWKNLFVAPGDLGQEREAVLRRHGAAVRREGSDGRSERRHPVPPERAQWAVHAPKLALGNPEEAFPSSLPEKIPGFLGASTRRVRRRSPRSNTGCAPTCSTSTWRLPSALASTSTTRAAQSIGRLVNSLTARGDIGKAEVANLAFFSLRKLKSDVDFLTAHRDPLTLGVTSKETPFVQKRAAENLVKVIAGTAAVLAVARAIKPESVETDPRSTDFGRIRINDTRFDVTAGMGAIGVLAARLALHSTKTGAGKVTPLNSGKYNSPTGEKLVYNFFTNKFSPAAGVVRDILKGEDFDHNPVSIKGELSNALVPLPFSNWKELHDAKNAPVLAGILADALGVSVKTYSAKKIH